MFHSSKRRGDRGAGAVHAPEARGRLAVDGWLRVVGAPGMVALGNRPGHSAGTWLGLGLGLGLEG